MPGLQGWLATGHNRYVAAGGGVAAAAGLGLYIRHRKAAAGTPATPATGTASGQYAPGTPGYYDSTSTDLYNSIESQLQALQTNLSNQLAGLQPGPASSPAGPPPVAHTSPYFDYPGRANDRYVRNAANGFIYQVDPEGFFYHLSGPQFAALGDPKYTQYGVAPAPAPKPPVRRTPPNSTRNPKR